MMTMTARFMLHACLLVPWLLAAPGCGGDGDEGDQGNDDHSVTFPDLGSPEIGGGDEGIEDPGNVVDNCVVADTCPCVPDCGGRICGDGGCGGSCGTCDMGKVCNDGQCLVMPMMDLGDGTLMDPGSDLLWQKIWVGEWEHAGALAYCEKNQAGLPGTGWRMPSLDESRSLVRGCPYTGTDGSCVLGEECLSEEDCWHGKCAGCPEGAGPDGGCYRDGLLMGECGAYWTSSGDSTNGEHAWYVDFFTVGIKAGHKANPRGVRCVRQGP